MIDFFEGMLKVTNVVLSIIAGYIAIGLYSMSRGRKKLMSWGALAGALLFFMIQGILGALRAFGIFSSPFLTHIVPTIILGLLIYALALQIHINIVEK
ncbi:MAG: hypothetical protein KAK00_01445 [Nanoarchaeota archaeon]|nr:hypothetical protein [Nanoarchaeota archaeon]